jgi:hypothetical protein
MQAVVPAKIDLLLRALQITTMRYSANDLNLNEQWIST